MARFRNAWSCLGQNSSLRSELDSTLDLDYARADRLAVSAELLDLCSRCRGMEHLQQDQDRVQQCLDAATHCEQRAASTKEPTARATFAEAARC